jgi:hypothetical protein
VSKKMIFGLGTGRCGSMSLANLLSYQKDCLISHELGGLPWLTWKPLSTSLNSFLERIMQRPERIAGDVSFYSLPYVNILMDRYDDIKFVILKRDKEETIKSYMKKTQGRNHWMSHNGSEWRLDIWDRCYPKFNVDTKEEALSHYYDHYYELCQQLPQEKCFWLQSPDLNDESRCLEMLRFCEFDAPQFKIFKKNEGSNG